MSVSVLSSVRSALTLRRVCAWRGASGRLSQCRGIAGEEGLPGVVTNIASPASASAFSLLTGCGSASKVTLPYFSFGGDIEGLALSLQNARFPGLCEGQTLAVTRRKTESVSVPRLSSEKCLSWKSDKSAESLVKKLHAVSERPAFVPAAPLRSPWDSAVFPVPSGEPYNIADRGVYLPPCAVKRGNAVSLPTASTPSKVQNPSSDSFPKAGTPLSSRKGYLCNKTRSDKRYRKRGFVHRGYWKRQHRLQLKHERLRLAFALQGVDLLKLKTLRWGEVRKGSSWAGHLFDP